ncbi:MAG: 50S ribosomal protein L18 [Nanoarchaeota archaeon]|nr:50S ribosomal protein L18 [Nanoarchaeota archaeon]
MKIIPKRRRREQKTDYKTRLNLLKSGLTRIVFRKSNKYIIGQVVKSSNAQDKIIFTFNSKYLLKNGWPENKKGSLKSLPAAYLTGYFLGKESKVQENVILDIGMIRNIPNSKPFAFLKGLVDAGVKINHNKEALPDDKLIRKDKELSEIIDKLIK